MDADPPREESLPPPVAETVHAIMARRAREMQAAAASERIAAAVTRFLGSMWSVATHAAVFGCWIVANLGLVPGLAPWDPTFVVLGMIASVEAIFLTTFVLINQNRLARIDDERSELALQVALLTEKETSTLVALTARLAGRLEVPVGDVGEDVDALTVATEPSAILDEIRRQKPDSL
ncbi:MAG TPA: DUF1003 domain-containing protein [Amaricoccus sp.]|nr:DUF1003 domain-containing protein [Amaricoccus sp.]